MAQTVKGPIKLNDSNIDVMLDVPPEKADEVRKLLDENLTWKQTSDNYELVESHSNVHHTYNPDGVRLHYYLMRQKSKPKGIVFTVHGYAASQRVNASWTANVLAANGYEVVGFDNEGHGRNVASKKDRCQVYDWRKLVYNAVAFMEVYLKHEEKRLKDVPIFLWGMSMGGAIVSSILGMKEFKKTQDRLSGAVLVCPFIESTQKPGWFGMQALIMMSAVNPAMGFGPGAILISNYEDQLDWFKKHEDTYSDPVKIGMGRELVRLSDIASKNCSNITTPLIVFHGDKDNMCSYAAAVKFFKSVKSKKKTFIRLKDMLHDIMWDRCTADVVDLTLQWLDIQTKGNVGNNEDDDVKEEEIEGEDD